MATTKARAMEKKELWKELWPAMLSALASLAFHAAHMGAVLTAAGISTGLAHAHHAQHGGAAGVDGWVWLSWVGWGVNGVTLLLAGHLFVKYWRHRRDDRRKAASHLTVCLISFAIVFAAIGLTLQ
jgi:Na+/proline symporter